MPPIIREHRIGDIGWAIERHGTIYHKEFGWNEEFEALVASLFAKFATQHDPAKERCWIAENHGERVGCVFVVNAMENQIQPSFAVCLSIRKAADSALDDFSLRNV